MSKPRLIPILCLSFMALFALGPVQADPLPTIRPSEWAQPLETPYTLFQMSPTLYRGGTLDQGALALLETLKVRTVITFLPESDASWLSSPGITQVQLPYKTNHVDDSQVLSALRAIETGQSKGPVLMHCKRGSDRTGLMAAMYRVVVQGWSKEDALREMTEGGFDDSAHFKDSIRYMMRADVDKLHTALVNGECSTSVFATCSMKSWLKTVSEGKPAP
ncbi:protein tyrosine/serine phosphatase [Pseudomonas sp. ok272]|uniref:phosphatase domain-containing protein n=1 Tax=unclassified Pseudomonas TaxID=196821 RepID=UPI0008AE9945|nr:MULTISPECIES: tyrosine-protein phosphatase [unclassified Pseudomonas]SEM64121.1 protein tyrosine/serine phosphatase [Pseudomonas sp. ok272]SFM45579.1 protein tyrosine/serine phosphatase [Pseudomonas sp. ok602]